MDRFSFPRLIAIGLLVFTVLLARAGTGQAQNSVIGDCNCSGALDAGDPVCAVLRLVGAYQETCVSFCGNAVIEPGEDCDLNDVSGGGQDCTSIGFGVGTLGCAAGCQFDTSGCVTTTTTTTTTLPPPAVCPVVGAGSDTACLAYNAGGVCKDCCDLVTGCGNACGFVFNETICEFSPALIDCNEKVNEGGCADECCP